MALGMMEEEKPDESEQPVMLPTGPNNTITKLFKKANNKPAGGQTNAVG